MCHNIERGRKLYHIVIEWLLIYIYYYSLLLLACWLTCAYLISEQLNIYEFDKKN